MTSLHAPSLRLSLVAISLFVILIPIVQEPARNLRGIAEWSLYCPGIFFALGVIASYRTSSMNFLLSRICLFVISTVVTSIGVILFTIFLVKIISFAAIIAGGALGAVLVIALMRGLLGYRPRGLIGWIVPMVAGALSQLFAYGVIELRSHNADWIVLVPWFSLLWWWFVGEALLWQQRRTAHASNYASERPHGAVD